MFQCLHKESKNLINSVSQHWIDRGKALKFFDKQDILVCQNCGEPLTYRRGKINRPHFSHRKATDCPLQQNVSNEEETTAKVFLFQLLENLLDSDIHMDTLLDGEDRTIDLLILKEGKPHFALWILSKDRRTAGELKEMASRHEIGYEFIYTKSKCQEKDGQLELSKAQRDHLAIFPLLDPVALNFRGHVTTLHVEDSQTAAFKIYRGLRQISTKQHEFKFAKELKLNGEKNSGSELAIHSSGFILFADEIKRASEQEQYLRELEEQKIKQAEQRKLRQAEQLAQQKRQQELDAKAEREYQEFMENERQRLCIYCKERTTHWKIGKKGRRCVCINCEPIHRKTAEGNKTESTDLQLETPPSMTDPSLVYKCRGCGKQNPSPDNFRQSDLTWLCPACQIDVQNNAEEIEW